AYSNTAEVTETRSEITRIYVSLEATSRVPPEPPSNHASSPMHRGVVNVHNYEVCIKVCWPEEPTCPEGWGDGDYHCWTCCKKTGDEDL
ncbi:unnamed protein product, partial [Fusarium graminearum]